jgi:ankyrin repeat protein
MTTSLHTAITENDEEKFRTLVSNSVNFNLQDSTGNNPVHAAVIAGRPEMLRELAKAGADLNALNRNNESPLELAFNAKNTEMVKLLIELGASITTKFKDGTTLLHNIVRTADPLLDFALQHGAPVGVQDRKGNTPLHTAIQLSATKPDQSTEFTNIAKKLVEHVGNPKIFDQINLLRKSPRGLAQRYKNEVVLKAMELRQQLLEIRDTIKKPHLSSSAKSSTTEPLRPYIHTR